MRKFVLGRFSIKHNSAAFTLIELLVVIAVLAALGVGTVSFINPQGQFDKARDVQIKNDLKQLQTALDAYYDDFQRYPPLNGAGPCGSGISALTSGSKKYIKVIPTPPGGGCYTYQRDNTTGRWYVILANHNHAISPDTACPSSISSGCLATDYTPATNYSCVYGGNITCPAAPNTPVPPTPTSGGGPIVPIPTVPPVDLPFGTGIDGPLNVTGTVNLSTFQSSGRSCADAARFRVISLTDNTSEVDTNPASNNCIRSGDEVMLINLQGTTSSTVNSGNYEFLRVQSVSNSGPPHIITFSANKTKFYGDNSGDDSNIGINATLGSQQRVILQRVPNYSRATVHPGGILTAALWDASVVEYECESTSVTGTRGGVLALKAFDTVGILGEIDMNAKGFLGGRSGGASFSGSGSNNHSLKGESIAGRDPFVAVGSATCGGANTPGQTQPANIGGGGSAQGTQSTPNPASTVTAGSGGGGNYGGTATNGTNGNINSTILYGGVGSSTYGYSALSKFFMGSGGGGGGSLNPQNSLARGGNGGRGGGIIHIGARNIVGSGVIRSNGEIGFQGVRGVYLGNSYDAGSGGGGSGGSINIDSDEFGLDNTQLQVNFGVGGTFNGKFGGNGGKGRARVDNITTLFRSLVSYWKMDEASGQMVRDSNARHNGISTSSTNVTAGKSGFSNARSFNGTSDYVYTHDSPLLTLSQVTLNAWIKTTATDGTILSQYNGGVQEGILFYMVNGKLVYHDGSGFWVTSNGSVNDGNWHMVTYAQSNNSDHKLYIDGAFDISNTNVAGIQNSTELLQIGARLTSGSPSNFFTGTIDEAGIWSRALSVSEIGMLYASGNGKTYPLDPSNTVYLAASPSTIISGNSLTVNWKNIQNPNFTDFFGLYLTSNPFDCPKPAGWKRVGCSQTSVNAVTTGSCTYTAPSTSGTYEFRLFSNDNCSSQIAKSNPVTVNPAPPLVFPVAGLINYWNMNEVSPTTVINTTADVGTNGWSSVNSNITNSGKIIRARTFNGSSEYLNFSAGQTAPTSGISVSMWCNVTALNQNNCFVNKHDTSTGTGYRLVMLSNNTFVWEVGNTSGGWPARYNIACGPNGVLVSTTGWYHVVGIHSTTDHRIYVNNYSCGNAGGPYSQNSLPLWMGRNVDPGNESQYSVGIIDEVGIWNRALSAAEVSDLYNGGVGLPYANRVFVTSATYNGNLGGSSGANTKCQSLANSVSPSLGGSWRAWLSDSVLSPSSAGFTGSSEYRLRPFMLLNGTIIANNWTDLTDVSLQNPINRTEKNQVDTSGDERVWTGTNWSGDLLAGGFPICADWTNSTSSSQGPIGAYSQYTGSTWTYHSLISCSNNSIHLYCFQQ